jgi:hypothetical protein
MVGDLEVFPTLAFALDISLARGFFKGRSSHSILFFILD